MAGSQGSGKAKAFATEAIHWGYDAADHDGALNPPLHLSSTYSFKTAEQGGDIFAGEAQGYFYSRIQNPTVAVLEDRIARLEGGEAGLATASGMGAICSVIWTLVSAGDTILVHKLIYGCSYAFFSTLEDRFGIKVDFIDMTDPAAIKAAITPQTKAAFLETPCNPNLDVIDIAAVKAALEGQDICLIVDNTFATPYLQQPLGLGADVVVHSATKYMGGHGDLIAGLVVSSAELIARFRLEGVKDLTGASLSAFDANLILRGLKTLELRMQRHCDSALQVATYLQSHPLVEKIWYPGLPSCQGHSVAAQQMRHYGGLVAFEVKGGMAAGKALLNALGLITLAVSLGDAETLIQHPASMTHAPYSPEAREVAGISDGLVRLSVGLEGVDDIIADLDQAFDALGSSLQFGSGLDLAPLQRAAE